MSMEDRFRSTLDKVMDELGPEAFVCWFDCGAGETNIKPKIQDAKYAYKLGFWGFFFSVLRSPVVNFIQTPDSKVALEIGYGGGRLINAAARVFKHVIGVDIHTHNKFVLNALKDQGIENVELHTTEGKNLPVDDQSIDFIYSFIVFVHLSSPKILETYLTESYRVLKKGGIASFYYGRPYSYRTNKSKNKFIQKAYSIIELIAEFLLLDFMGDGYRYNPEVQANSVSLTVTRRKIRQFTKKIGFNIKSQQSNPEWSQGFIVLQKPL